MELRQLEYFLMVSEVQSFTRAAERLYISQPAVTNAIRSLENELEIQLFDRSQKKILLTSEGKIFYHHVKHVMKGISNTLSEINNLKNLNSGLIVIGLTYFSIFDIGTKILQEFNHQFPNVVISISEKDLISTEQELVEETIDIAFTFKNDNPMLSYIPLANDELVVCCGNKHKLRYKNSIDWISLKNEKFIMSPTTTFFQMYIKVHLDEFNIVPHFLFEPLSVQTIKNLVAGNSGISILPRNLCEADSNLITIPFYPPIYLPYYLAFKKNRIQSHATKSFIEFSQKNSYTGDDLS